MAKGFNNKHAQMLQDIMTHGRKGGSFFLYHMKQMTSISLMAREDLLANIRAQQLLSWKRRKIDAPEWEYDHQMIIWFFEINQNANDYKWSTGNYRTSMIMYAPIIK